MLLRTMVSLTIVSCTIIVKFLHLFDLSGKVGYVYAWIVFVGALTSPLHVHSSSVLAIGWSLWTSRFPLPRRIEPCWILLDFQGLFTTSVANISLKIFIDNEYQHLSSCIEEVVQKKWLHLSTSQAYQHTSFIQLEFLYILALPQNRLCSALPQNRLSLALVQNRLSLALLHDRLSFTLPQNRLCSALPQNRWKA